MTGGAVACLLLIGVLIGPGREIIGQVLRGESLSDVLAGRSPGRRGTADLVKIKGDAGLNQAAPRQRVLPLLRTRDPVGPVEEAALPGGGFADPADPFGPPGGGFSDDFTDAVFPGGPVGGEPIGFPIASPGNPGLFPVDPAPPTTEVPETPAPAIPEPGTWAMLLIGLGIVGSALRRARSSRNAAEAAH
jgi:hypothetical protein